MDSYIDIRWYAEDIKYCAQDNEIELTDKECIEILESLKKNHDATIGINWDVILCEIENLKGCW